MGSNTSDHDFYKPAEGETGWASAKNSDWDDLDTRLIVKDTKANRPSAGTSGRWYLATDENILYRDNGTSWVEVGGLGSSGSPTGEVFRNEITATTDGTASDPVLEINDADTGIFRPTTDTFGIATGGTEALRVNSSQNLDLQNNNLVEPNQLQTGGGGSDTITVRDTSNSRDLAVFREDGGGNGLVRFPSSDSNNFAIGLNSGDGIHFESNNATNIPWAIGREHYSPSEFSQSLDCVLGSLSNEGFAVINDVDGLVLGIETNGNPRLLLPNDVGATTMINGTVTSSPTAGTEESYSFDIDGTTIAKAYAEADGAGGIQNAALRINQPIENNSGTQLLSTSQSSAYSTSNVTTDRTYDADSTTTSELADVLGTLISDLQAHGLIG